jgi:hypothetical protein
MNQSFVPKLKGISATDDRELGLMVYHLFVGEADRLGDVKQVVEAVPVTVGPIVASAQPVAGASPAPGASPAAGKTASPVAKPSATAKPVARQ